MASVSPASLNTHRSSVSWERIGSLRQPTMPSVYLLRRRPSFSHGPTRFL